MKKLLVLFIVALAIAISPPLLAKKEEGLEKGGGTMKFWVCHRTEMISDGNVYSGWSLTPIAAGEIVGQLILVSERSIPAHCAHGDRVFDLENNEVPQDWVIQHGLCRPDGGPGYLDLDCADF